MTVAITLEELLAWNEESSRFWNAHFAANPALLQLPCDIGGTATVQEFLRHIWGVELRWAQRLAGVPETPREEIPTGPLRALFDLHVKADEAFRALLTAPDASWDELYTLNVLWIPPESRTMTRRKVFAHALFHSQRHWPQMATLLRATGHPSGFKGDLLFTSAMR